MSFSSHKIWTTRFAALLVGLLLNGSITLPMQAAEPKSAPNVAVNSCSTTTPLTPEEQAYARTAWQYFRNNYQPATGFVNSVENYPSASLWDLGNYLMALNAARSLNLIDQADFDYRLNQFLTTLGRIKLFEDALPNKTYNTQTGEMVDYNNKLSPKGIGWSALDLGRVLTALYVLQRCHPSYQNWIQSIVSKWQLQRSVANGQLIGATVLPRRTLMVQEGRLGYEEYAARGFQLWGLNPSRALDRREFRGFVEIYGLRIPVDRRNFRRTNANNYVLSESYILHGVEFGFDSELAEIAAKILEVQKRRYDATGKLTAVSEDHVKGAPYFLYNTIYANGVKWATITEKNKQYPQLRSVSTKAAFGWYYLYPNNAYAQALLNAVKTLQNQQNGGFYAGIYEATQKPNQVLTANTNGLILELLHFKARGSRPFVESASTAGTKTVSQVSVKPPSAQPAIPQALPVTSTPVPSLSKSVCNE